MIVEGDRDSAIAYVRNICRFNLCDKGEICRCRICQPILDGMSFSVGEFGSQDLSVKEVRKGIVFLSRKSIGYHAVVFTSWFGLSEKSASALLKILEEPPVNAQIFLLLKSQWLVPPTVSSRCLVAQAGNSTCGTSYLEFADKSFEDRLKLFRKWSFSRQLGFRVSDVIHSLWQQSRYEDALKLSQVLVRGRGSISVNDIAFQVRDIR